jgi:hypothetical protein
MFTITQRGLNEVGFFDENVFPVYEEDIEWMMRTMRLQNSRRPDGSYFSPREARRPDRVVQIAGGPHGDVRRAEVEQRSPRCHHHWDAELALE